MQVRFSYVNLLAFFRKEWYNIFILSVYTKDKIIMKYRIGLDIGIASVGWAVLQNLPNGEPCRILGRGVRVFEAAEQPKDGKSLAEGRREARGIRRDRKSVV